MTFSRKMNLAWLGLALAMSVSSAAALRSAYRAPTENGKTLFNSNCASCHGEDGSGNTPVGRALGAADLRSQKVQSMTDDQIATQIRNGKGNMPPFASRFDEQQVHALIGYIRSLRRK